MELVDDLMMGSVVVVVVGLGGELGPAALSEGSVAGSGVPAVSATECECVWREQALSDPAS